MQMGGVFLVVIFAALIIAGIVSGRKKKRARQSIRYLSAKAIPRVHPQPKKRTVKFTVRFSYLSITIHARRKGGCLPCRSDCREAAVRHRKG